MSNKRKFFIDNSDNSICYVDKNEIKKLDDLKFDSFNEAFKYIKDNNEELNVMVDGIKIKDKINNKKNKKKVENETDTVSEKKSKRVKVKKLKKKDMKEDNGKQKDTNKKKNGWKRYLAGFLSALVLLPAGHFISNAIVNKNDKDNDVDNSNDNELEDTMDNSIVDDDKYSNDKNTYTVSSDEVSRAVSSITTDREMLTTDGFENLVAEFASNYVNNNIDVSVEDVTKFVSIANIDLLAEENWELASQLFSVQTKEEYINDAAKVIGATVMYNYQQYMNDRDTTNFIRISDAVVGEGHEELLIIEEYTEKIANASLEQDRELVNQLVSEFITELNSGSLSKMDDGVGFASQVNIALIADIFAAGYLNQENFDMLQILKTSEKYVSNIFSVYEGCSSTNDFVVSQSYEVDNSMINGRVRTRSMI